MKGWLAAQLVARLTGEANRWMVDCLEVGRDDRVLDVGCGPGLAVAYAAGLTDGPVVGVDASDTMVRQALRRNRAAVRQGRVDILRADAAGLPLPDGHFSKAGSLNSLQFWTAPEQGLAELHRVLGPGGRVAVVLMARSDETTGPDPPPWVEEAVPPWVEETVSRVRAAGFGDLVVESRTFGGVLHRALIGSRREKRVAPPLDPTADGVRRGAGP